MVIKHSLTELKCFLSGGIWQCSAIILSLFFFPHTSAEWRNTPFTVVTPRHLLTRSDSSAGRARAWLEPGTGNSCTFPPYFPFLWLKHFLINVSPLSHRCLPMNLTAEDLASGVLRDRAKVGTSLADVDPMNLDTTVRARALKKFTSTKFYILMTDSIGCLVCRWGLITLVVTGITFSRWRRWLCSHCFTLRSLRSSRFSLPGEFCLRDELA